jgi:hypothetical protein
MIFWLVASVIVAFIGGGIVWPMIGRWFFGDD